MVGNVGAWSVEPVVNPALREARRRRLIRATNEQVAGRVGPVRQTRHRDEVVSPIALEFECRGLLQRAQQAIGTIMASQVYAGDLRGTVQESVLRQHEWDIAVALREMTELMLDLVPSYGGGAAGPMTSAVLGSQTRAISMAREAVTARVAALESLAAQVAAAEAARRDWETAHRLAANNDKFRDLVARTAADQHATADITGLAEQAAAAAQAFRETLQRATLAAEALALPGPGPRLERLRDVAGLVPAAAGPPALAAAAEPQGAPDPQAARREHLVAHLVDGACRGRPFRDDRGQKQRVVDRQEEDLPLPVPVVAELRA